MVVSEAGTGEEVGPAVSLGDGGDRLVLGGELRDRRPPILLGLDALVGREFGDDRIGRIIEAGTRKRLFFERVPLPEMDSRSAALVKVQAAEYIPVRSTAAAGLVAFAREYLRSQKRSDDPSAGSESSRTQLDAALRPRTSGAHGPVAPAV